MILLTVSLVLLAVLPQSELPPPVKVIPFPSLQIDASRGR
jgi:hypothetical protein